MISFVIPTLNEASVLEKTLEWMALYSGEKEIILSDGKSRDTTLEIAKKYTDKIVVYDKPERQTIGMARNMGAALASGEYVCFIDADVVIRDPDSFFAKILDIFQKDQKVVAVTAFMKVFPELETRADNIIFTGVNYLYVLLNNVLRIGGSGWEFQFVKRTAFERVHGFDERLPAGEDNDHFRRLARVGKTVSAKDLTFYHTGRRAHKIGWPRLLMDWSIACLPLTIKKHFLKEWKEVR